METSDRRSTDPQDLVAGDDPIRRLARSVDWRSTPLGPPETWPARLRMSVGLCMDSPTPIAIWAGPDFHVVYNEGYAKVLGPRHPAAMGRPVREVWPEVADGLQVEFAQVVRSGVGTRHENTPFRLQRGDREEDAYFTFTVSPIREADGRVSGLFNITEETTGMERALASSEAHFRELIESMPVPVAVNDANGNILVINARFTQVFGYTRDDVPDVDTWFRKAYPNDTYRRYVIEAWSEALRVARESGTSVPIAEFQVTAADGRERIAAISGSPVGSDLIVVLEDITETRLLQGRLAMASRLAALGTLVSGVAHEINNPLSAELAGQGLALELAREARDTVQGPGPLDRAALAVVLGEVIEAMGEAQEAGQRIARVVKDLSTFGRPDATRTRASLAEIVEKALRWLPASVREVATLGVEDQGAPDVIVAVGQIQQVVVNLVTNASRAIAPGGRGEIVIRTGPGESGRARLEVVDRGVGIPAAIRERIFDPFFTTRPTGEGRGTGLGLAICHDIVASHGGAISVESEVGKGSTFRVELPAAVEPR